MDSVEVTITHLDMIYQKIFPLLSPEWQKKWRIGNTTLLSYWQPTSTQTNRYHKLVPQLLAAIDQRWENPADHLADFTLLGVTSEQLGEIQASETAEQQLTVLSNQALHLVHQQLRLFAKTILDFQVNVDNVPSFTRYWLAWSDMVRFDTAMPDVLAQWKPISGELLQKLHTMAPTLTKTMAEPHPKLYQLRMAPLLAKKG